MGAQIEPRPGEMDRVLADLVPQDTTGGAVFVVPGTQLVYATVHDGVKRDFSLYAANLPDVLAGKAQWRRLFGEDARITAMAMAGGWLYAKCALDAPRYKLLRMPVAEVEPARGSVSSELSPITRSGTVTPTMVPFGDERISRFPLS